MGRANIIGETGAGLYLVEVKHDTSTADIQVAKLDALIASVETRISEIEDGIAVAEAEVDVAEEALETAEEAVPIAQSNLDAAESAMNADPLYQQARLDLRDAQNELSAAQAEDPVSEIRVQQAMDAVADAQVALENVTTKIAYEEAKDEYEQAVKEKDNAQTELTAAEAQLDQLEKKRVLFETRLMALEKRKSIILAAKNLDFQTPAWCADLTSGLSGDVGTIEPGSEYGNGINLRPGADGDAGWNLSRDGQAVPFLTMHVADAMRNFAILPAVQKWRPNYRYGIISDIDVGANTCRVTLEPLFSSQQDIDINQSTALDDVPIEYMTCNAAAFTEGDAVIVQFEGFSWDSPKVIGFKDHPKSCYPILVLGCNDQWVAWDFINQEVLSLGEIEQPTDYWTIYSALQAMGFTVRIRMVSESVGSGVCDTWNPAVFSSYAKPDIDIWWPNSLESNQAYPTSYFPNYYGATSNTNESAGGGTIINTIHIDVYLLLEGEGAYALPDGETFQPSYHEEKKIYSHVVREIYLGTLVSSTGGGYKRSDLSERKAVNGLVAARLSHTPGEKRRACFFYQDGNWNYYQSGVDREVSYEKKISYRSGINPDDSAEDVTEVTGACASYSCEYSILNEYNNDSKFSTAAPVKAMLKDELAFVLEQPVVYNEQTGETWGFSKLYFTTDGAKPDELSDYEYDWEDLVLMDMDAIYSAFGTTFNADMASRHASAGLTAYLFSSE